MSTQQNVNLYAKLDRSGPALGALAWVGGAASATVLGYAAIAVLTWFQTAGLEAAAAERSTSNVVIERRLAELRADPYAARNLAVRNDIDALRDERAMKERVLGVLRRPQQNQRQFSEVLLGLARQHQPGIALSSIRVTGDFETVNIGGAVERPDLVPRYLYDLGTEPAFAGLTFARIAMARDEDAALTFEASSSMGTADARPDKRLNPEQLADDLLSRATAGRNEPDAPLPANATASAEGI